MATTKIWQIGGRLDNVMRYVVNPAKTWNGNYEEAAKYHQLGSVLQYTADEMKTEQQFFVTGINSSSEPEKRSRNLSKRKRRGAKQEEQFASTGISLSRAVRSRRNWLTKSAWSLPKLYGVIGLKCWCQHTLTRKPSTTTLL